VTIATGGASEEPVFQPNLYHGTADDYDRYRLPYPSELLADLRIQANISGSGRLLDLACGTGQIAFALAGAFGQIVAVDQQADSVAFCHSKAHRLGVTNITWIAGRAEDVAIDGPFELIAIGNAFHRLRRTLVAERANSWLQPGGHLALLWSSTPWTGRQDWQVALTAAFEEWKERLGATDRVPAGWEEALDRDPNARVLERAGFEFIGDFTFSHQSVWTVETLIGFTYSTSFLSREVVGPFARDFETDMSARLLRCHPDGRFEHVIDCVYELARRSRSQ
jgi:SAM-dependent methyltransferase